MQGRLTKTRLWHFPISSGTASRYFGLRTICCRGCCRSCSRGCSGGSLWSCGTLRGTYRSPFAGPPPHSLARGSLPLRGPGLPLRAAFTGRRLPSLRRQAGPPSLRRPAGRSEGVVSFASRVRLLRLPLRLRGAVHFAERSPSRAVPLRTCIGTYLSVPTCQYLLVSTYLSALLCYHSFVIN